jgi:predicted lipoprotein
MPPQQQQQMTPAHQQQNQQQYCCNIAAAISQKQMMLAQKGNQEWSRVQAAKPQASSSPNKNPTNPIYIRGLKWRMGSTTSEENPNNWKRNYVSKS